MSELLSGDLTDKVYDRLGGTVPVFPTDGAAIHIDLHVIVKATIEELADAGYLTVVPAETTEATT